MTKTIVVVGFGPATSSAVAERFGSQGFQVALVGRNKDRLDAGATSLNAKGIKAAAFPADAGDADAIRRAIREIRGHFGGITVLHWNAAGGAEVGDLTTASPATVHTVFDIAVTGLLAAVQEVIPDMRGTNEGAILVTNGAFADLDPELESLVVASNAMGMALSNATKHKLVRLLATRLKPDDIYVGEVMVAGTIKGSPWARDNAIDPLLVAGKFWDLYQGRTEPRARVW